MQGADLAVDKLSQWRIALCLWHPTIRVPNVYESQYAGRHKRGDIAPNARTCISDAHFNGEKLAGTTSMFCIRNGATLGGRLSRASTTDSGQIPALDVSARIRSRSPAF